MTTIRDRFAASHSPLIPACASIVPALPDFSARRGPAFRACAGSRDMGRLGPSSLRLRKGVQRETNSPPLATLRVLAASSCCSPAVCACYHSHDGVSGQPGHADADVSMAA